MIGPTNANGNVVTVGTPQTITGQKTFTAQLVRQGSNPFIVLRDSNLTGSETLPLSAYRSGEIHFRGTGNTSYGRVAMGLNTAGDGYFINEVYDHSHTYNARLTIRAYTDEQFMTGPYRTSNITNDDVLTAGNGVTLGTAQTITGVKTFSGTIPTTQPANGDGNSSYELKFYGGSTVSNTPYIYYNNNVARNRDGKQIMIWGPFQAGSTNSDGYNGFRMGFRNREDTAWGKFLNIYHGGQINWGGFITLEGARAYNTNNTNDVVTIGMLNGDMTLAGYKTLSRNLKLTQAASPTIEMRNTTYSTSDATFNDWHGGIFNYDNNDNYAGIIGWIRYGDDIEHLKLRATRMVSNSAVNSEIDLRVYNDGTCCAMAPARAYANAGNQQNSSDIITKWHLESAITIGGAKTFTNYVQINGGSRIDTALKLGDTSANGCLEIYHTTPFIDFHYNRSSSDYTARVINNTDGNLQFTINDTSNNTATMNLSSSGYLQVPSPVPATSAARNITISDQAPSGGNNGDIWIQYEV